MERRLIPGTRGRSRAAAGAGRVVSALAPWVIAIVATGATMSVELAPRAVDPGVAPQSPSPASRPAPPPRSPRPSGAGPKGTSAPDPDFDASQLISV